MKRFLLLFFPCMLLATSPYLKKVERFFSLYAERPVSVWHEVLYFSSSRGLVFLEDGSVWEVNPKEKKRLRKWKKEDLVFIQQNTSWNSSYPYALKNKIVNETVEVALSLAPDPRFNRGSSIKEVDLSSGLVTLKEGSIYNICFFPGSEITDWKAGDPLLIGVNSSFLRRGDFILINARSKKFVYAMLEQEGDFYESR